MLGMQSAHWQKKFSKERCLKPFLSCRLDKLWLVDWSDIELDQQIGAGANGAIHHGIYSKIFFQFFVNISCFFYYYYSATWKGVEVAVKLMGGNILGEDAKEVATSVPISKELQTKFIEEAYIMTTLRHPVRNN